MKYKFILVLLAVVVAGIGFTIVIKIISQAITAQNTDKSSSLQSDRSYFERNLAKRRIPFVLPDVYRLDVIKLKDSRDWDTYYSGQQPLHQPGFLKAHTFTLSENSKILKMLRQTSSFHTETLQHKNTQNIVVDCWTEHDYDAAPFSYVYLPESGRLGKNHDWCQMSSKLQHAINTAVN